MNAPASPQTTRWLEAFTAALAQRDPRAVAELFVPDCYWRDLLAFTWDIRTHEGREALSGLFSVRTSDFKLKSEPTNTPEESWFSFSTAAGHAVGHVRLREGRAWTLLTALRTLHDHPERPVHALAREPDLGVTRQP
ncbi:MAG: nuclear transport factor 2 family protein, partial [Betaproteobacteria bacterium]|nr:nuclear transport factor 2 family protein [Betaproteobacteria bacterium]